MHRDCIDGHVKNICTAVSQKPFLCLKWDFISFSFFLFFFCSNFSEGPYPRSLCQSFKLCCEPGRAFYLLRSSQQHFKWCETGRLAGRILVYCCRAHCTGEQKAQHMASPSSSAGSWSVLGKSKGLTYTRIGQELLGITCYVFPLKTGS